MTHYSSIDLNNLMAERNEQKAVLQMNVPPTTKLIIIGNIQKIDKKIKHIIDTQPVLV